MMTRAFLLVALGLTPVMTSAQALIVVGNDGGASALPYYHALHLTPDVRAPNVPAPPHPPYREADLLPVRSTRLTPGPVIPRTLRAPGLSPFFLVGDDAASHDWLRTQHDRLKASGAVGLVVNVRSAGTLASLRRLAPDLTLMPTSGDDIAARLGLRHYPVLVTATGIEP